MTSGSIFTIEMTAILWRKLFVLGFALCNVQKMCTEGDHMQRNIYYHFLEAYHRLQKLNRIDALSGWYFTLNAIVDTLLFPFPYPNLFIDISNAGNWIGSHSLPSWN